MEQPITKSTTDNLDVIVIKLADSKIPKFKESKNRDFIRYGEDNNYGESLSEMYNKSAKHNAIVNGKAFYIFGLGFNDGEVIVNRLGETLNDVVKKCNIDIEVFGGFKTEVLYNYVGRISEIYHVSFNTLRVHKDGGFLFKEEWKKFDNGYDAVFIPEFNPKTPFGSQIFSYDEYRPNVKFYPLPGYVGANNYILTDIEISKYYLSAISNGMTPSKMIQFFDGEPTEDKKREIERRFKEKFAGSENTGNIILVFGKNKEKSVQVDDLSSTDLDKQFIEMNKTCQQEIFSGHLVTSGMLFGIKTEGQLGGSTELKTSFMLFQNTYAKPKADCINKEFKEILANSIWPGERKLIPVDPIGLQIDIKDVIELIPKRYILNSLGIPEEYLEDDVEEDGATKVVTASTEVNENLKNLTGRQHQALERIIRKHANGKYKEPQARMLLKSSLGLSDSDINVLLGITTTLSKDVTEDDVIAIFDSFGDTREDYEILKSKKVSFASNSEAEDDEEVYVKEAFSEYDVTQTEAKILELIKKDNRITADVIAKTIKQSVGLVKSKIDSLVKRGYLEITELKDGGLISTVAENISMPDVSIGKTPLSKISVKYSYEGPKDSRNRAFCRKLLDLDRLYSRADIEKISERLGYSVFDRRGGFWRQPNGVTTPYCRHTWKSNIVIKK